MWGRGISHYYHFVKNVSLWGAACDTGAVVEGVSISNVTGVSPVVLDYFRIN